MKKLKFFLPLAALGLLASCSNDDLGNQPDPTPAPEVSGTYLAFNIATAPGTRGIADEVGMPQESAVKNVWLYLFRNEQGQNKTESDALFWKEIQMANPSVVDDTHTGDNIVSKVITATFQLNDLTPEDKEKYDFYALIIVNKKDGLKVPEEGQKFSEWYGTQANAKQAYSGATIWNGTNSHAIGTVSTSNDLSKVDLVATSTSGAGVNDMIIVDGSSAFFTMTNAPLIGEDNEITILAVVDSGNFAESPAKAQDSAATVFVQRGVAKVYVQENADATHEIEGAEDAGQEDAVITIDGWALDVLNTATYPVQHVEAASQFGDSEPWSPTYFTEALSGHDSDGSRILWSIDPEYFNAAFKTDPSEDLYLSNVNGKWNNLTDVEYCLENTMDFDKMQKNQSTRVILQASVKLDGSEAKSFIYYPGSDLAYALTEDDQIADSAPAGLIQISELTTDATTKSNILSAVGALNDQEKVYYYPDGVAYYTAIIRHFVGENQPGATDTGYGKINILDDYKAKDLGRYGVVRNNTYVLKVGKVMGFGSPTVPPTTPDPDDKPDPIKYNVKLEIEVLNWTVRDHSYTIK